MSTWLRVGLAGGRTVDLLHARMSSAYAPHVHEHYSVGVCTQGAEVIEFGGRVYHADLDSVVVLEPGIPHTGGPASGGAFAYRALYPAADLMPGGAARFAVPVVSDPGLAASLRRMHVLLSGGLEPLEAESRLTWLLGELARRHGSTAPGTGGASSAVAHLVMSRLADQLTCPPTLAEIAAEAGLSRYQLVRAFRAAAGMPPYAWLAQHRVARARGLLDRGCAPAVVAALCGFADQPHLTRWFRRVVGVTPGVYRNSVQDSAARRG